MNLLFSFALIIHVILAVAIIVLVLLQHGKGADMGAAFGSGASGSLFGATGSANFLSRTTAILAAVFFLTSLGLTWLASTRHTTDASGVMGTVREQPAEAPKGAKGPGAPEAAGDVPKSDSTPPQPGEVPK